MVERLAPFGSGNPEPRFAVTDLRVVRGEVVGDGHVRLLLAGNGGTRLKAIAFRSADGPSARRCSAAAARRFISPAICGRTTGRTARACS